MISLARHMCLTIVLAFTATIGFAASDSDLKKRLSGKALVTENSKFELRRNGALKGKAGKTVVKGAWTVRDGKFCRTISEPENFKGTECQPMSFGDGTVTITGRNGPIEYILK